MAGNGCRWREFRRITKRTQSCAKRAGRRVCRRNFMDWLYRRPAKPEQERGSGATANLPETAIIPWARGTSPCSRMLAWRPFTPGCHSEGSEESVVLWCKAGSLARIAALGKTSIGLPRHTCACFRAEPKPTRSPLMGAGPRCLRRPGKRVRLGWSRNGRKRRSMAPNGREFAVLQNEPNLARGEAYLERICGRFGFSSRLALNGGNGLKSLNIPANWSEANLPGTAGNGRLPWNGGDFMPPAGQGPGP